MDSKRNFKAVFFDRDGTLCRNSVSMARERDQYIAEIISKSDFKISDEMNMRVFYRVGQVNPELRHVNTLEKEDLFWQKWYQIILEGHGIFNAALGSLNVKSCHSIFIDDCKIEADGAMEQGFTAFYLDRGQKCMDTGTWTIGNLEHLIDYLEGCI